METAIYNGLNDNSEGDEVLTAFAQTYGADLVDWMQRYPAHARDLARHAASRWAGETTPIIEIAPAEAAATAHVREVGLSIVRTCRAKALSVSKATTVEFSAKPLNSLLVAAQAKGLDPEGIADRLDVPYAFFFKLHRRLIAPDSVPRAFLGALAEAIGRTREEVATYLRQPPTLAMGASYRADDRPEVGGQESFTDALRSDPDATESQRRRWMESE